MVEYKDIKCDACGRVYGQVEAGSCTRVTEKYCPDCNRSGRIC